MKKWTVNRPDKALSDSLSVGGGLPKICADILVSRGIDTIDKARDFFGMTDESENGISLSDPFLIKDMEIAAEHIMDAVDCGKRICIYGDYDCDGITSTAVLYRYIECMGGDVSFHINIRSQGYGMCEEAVRKLSDDGIELIITVDNGISAVKEAELCAKLGMELIITDHHQPPEELPNAIAIVNPHRSDDMSPFKELCGCGVVLKLIAAMDGGDYSSAVEQFSDIAAIATIADIVTLTGENREIVRHGLHYLENTENLGLQALIKLAGIKGKIDSTTVAFMLAPRINASGRFGSAEDACRLLLCEDYEQAEELAQLIGSLNTERKSVEAEILSEIEEMIRNKPSILNNRVLVLYGKGWHHGVIGIIAARLVERFGKPVFIMSDDENEVRGSARSVTGFNAHSALSACSEVLLKYGGHSGAGGFSLSLDKIDAFDAGLQEYAAKNFAVMPCYALNADKIITPEELTVDTVNALHILEPFGEGNKQPVFAMVSVRLLDVMPLSGGNHTKLKLTYGNCGVYGLLFGTKTADFPYKSGDMLDMLVHTEINNYNGSSSVSLRIIDYRMSGLSQQKLFAAKNAYEKYMRGEGADEKLIPRIVPTRDELIMVYRAVPKTSFVSCDFVYSKLDPEMINYCKFRLSLDIFEELALFDVNRFTDTVKMSDTQNKVDLDSSQILSRLSMLTVSV